MKNHLLLFLSLIFFSKSVIDKIYALNKINIKINLIAKKLIYAECKRLSAIKLLFCTKKQLQLAV